MKLERKPWQAVVVSLLGASLVSMSGCGGGGGDPAPAEKRGATESSADGPTTVDANATASHFVAVEAPVVPPVVSTSSSSVAVAAAVTTSLRNLLILDTTTGKVAKQYAVKSWAQADRFFLDAAGEPHYQGTGHVYMIQNGKVMQLDLSSDTLGEPKQISSITNACWFGLANRVPPASYLALDGKHAWIPVLVADAGVSCDPAPSSYKTYLVASDMAVTDVGPAEWGKFNSTGPTFLGSLTGTQQVAQGVMMYAPSTKRLSVYSNDLKDELYVVTQGVPSTAISPIFRGLLPSSQKGLLQLDGVVYFMDWSSGKLSLKDLGINIAQTGGKWFQATDRQNAVTYLSDGTTIYAINAATGEKSTFGTIDASKGVLRALYVAEGDLVIYQGHNSDPSATPPQAYDNTVVAMNKSTKAARVLLDGVTDSVTIYDVNGDALMLSRMVQGASTLIRLTVSSGVPNTIFSGAGMNAYFYPLAQPARWGGFVYTDYVIFDYAGGWWSNGAAVSSYSVATGPKGQPLSLGALPKPNPAGGAWGLSTVWSSSSVPMTWFDQVWTLGPLKSDSLKQIWSTPN
jgi:hypothetical protein